MRWTLLLLLLKFVAVTVPLTWLWMNGGEEVYFDFYRRTAFPILALLGVTGFPPGMIRDRLISFIPFLALMLVTPQITWARRLFGIGLGFLLIFLSHIALSWWAWFTFDRGRGTGDTMTYFFPALVVIDALPFLLWAIFANRFLRQLLARVMPPAPPAAPTEASAPAADED